MFKNHLMIALRSIWRHKGYSFITIFGLAVGLALAFLVVLYIQDEISFDSFHENADRIYRIAQIEDHNGTLSHYMQIGPGINRRIETDFSDIVEKSVRLAPTGEVWTKIGDKLFPEEDVFIADDTLFDIFTFDFITGNPADSLVEPNSIVVSRSTAVKYFGGTDVLGETVVIDFPGAPLLKITGVFEDLPANSHFHPRLIVSFSTLVNDQNRQAFDQMFGNMVWSYILLKEGADVDRLKSQLPAFLDRHLDENLKTRLLELYLQPLRDLHLRSSTDPFTEIEPENTGNILYLYIFGIIAFLVVVVACINFMNMATARSAGRAREVGIRKVAGATRRELSRQFLGESVLIALLSFPLALGLCFLFLRAFNTLTGKSISVLSFIDPVSLLIMIGIVLFVGLLSGSYPAFFLSNFQPANVLRGRERTGGTGGVLRKVLVVCQFAVSIGFVIGTLIIIGQMNFMRNSDLGFEKDNVIVINAVLPEQPDERLRIIELLKNEFERQSGVISLSMASGAPSEIRNIVNGRKEGDDVSAAKQMVQVSVDPDYLATLGITLLEGRDFSKEFGADRGQSFIINEAVVRELGLQDPIGKTLVLGTARGTVVGVMKSPHWEPKRRVIFPMVFTWIPQQIIKIIVRLSPNDVPGTLASLEKIWNANVSTRPFQYRFLSDMVDDLYKSERRLGNMVLYFSLLTILIACLGLFGLASFTAEQKTKEIGIRKILGASAPGIVLLLSRQFGKLILIANLIAWPAAYFILRRWLDNFYYRIGIGVWAFAAAAALVIVIGLLSVSYQSLKAALSNPVDSLRYE